jgi:invasion protein IalB
MTRTGRISSALAITAAIAVFVSPATTPRANAQQQQQPPTNGWYKVCSKQEENDICNVTFQSMAPTGQLVTAISLLQVKGNINGQKFQVTVPPGRLLPSGIKVRIDENEGFTLPYLVCFPQRCIAEANLSQELVDRMKSGGQMTVTSTNFQAKPNPVAITLAGFTAAFDGEPLKQDELEARQRQLQEELQQKAEEQRRKLQEAQSKAKQGTE